MQYSFFWIAQACADWAWGFACYRQGLLDGAAEALITVEDAITAGVDDQRATAILAAIPDNDVRH